MPGRPFASGWRAVIDCGTIYGTGRKVLFLECVFISYHTKMLVNTRSSDFSTLFNIPPPSPWHPGSHSRISKYQILKSPQTWKLKKSCAEWIKRFVHRLHPLSHVHYLVGDLSSKCRPIYRTSVSAGTSPGKGIYDRIFPSIGKSIRGGIINILAQLGGIVRRLETNHHDSIFV